MPHLQPSVEILKGFGRFTKVITRGKRYEKHPLKAFVVITNSRNSSLNIGYTVTKRVRKSTYRNRLKRLMREAFLLKKADFINQLKPDTLVEIVFMYNGSAEVLPKTVRLSSITQAFSAICEMVFKE